MTGPRTVPDPRRPRRPHRTPHRSMTGLDWYTLAVSVVVIAAVMAACWLFYLPGPG